MQNALKLIMWENGGRPTAFQWFAWEILEIAGNDIFQAGDFGFIDSTWNKFYFPAVTTAHVLYPTELSGNWYSFEAPLNLLDYQPSTKFTMQQKPFMPFAIAFDLQSQCLDIKVFSRYQWWTANDSVQNNRSPVSWRVLASNDGQNWVVLDEIMGYIPPTQNLSLAFTSKELI